MRKFLAAYLLIGFCFANFIVDTQSNVAPTSLVGQSFVYNVLTSDLNVTLNRKDYSLDSFQFKQQQFPAQTDVEIEVTSVDDLTINYTQTIGASSFDETFYYFPDYYTTYMATLVSYYHNYILSVSSHLTGGFNEYGNISSSLYGPGLILELIYFLPANETVWANLDSIATYAGNISNYNVGNYYDLDSVQFSYQELSGFIYLEGSISGAIYQRDFCDGKFSNGFLMIYEKTTGLLYGVHIMGTFDGKMIDNNIRCDVDFHVELEDYAMPELSLYTPLKLSANIFVISFGLSFVTLVIIIIRKRKR